MAPIKLHMIHKQHQMQMKLQLRFKLKSGQTFRGTTDFCLHGVCVFSLVAVELSNLKHEVKQLQLQVLQSRPSYSVSVHPYYNILVPRGWILMDFPLVPPVGWCLRVLSIIKYPGSIFKLCKENLSMLFFHWAKSNFTINNHPAACQWIVLANCSLPACCPGPKHWRHVW